MSRIGDIAIGVIAGVGGLIGAALAWDKYGNSSDNNSPYPKEDTIIGASTEGTDIFDTEDIDSRGYRKCGYKQHKCNKHGNNRCRPCSPKYSNQNKFTK